MRERKNEREGEKDWKRLKKKREDDEREKEWKRERKKETDWKRKKEIKGEWTRKKKIKMCVCVICARGYLQGSFLATCRSWIIENGVNWILSLWVYWVDFEWLKLQKNVNKSKVNQIWIIFVSK